MLKRYLLRSQYWRTHEEVKTIGRINVSKSTSVIGQLNYKSSPRKILADNQLWMGNYTSDTYDSYGYGFGLTSYPGEITIATAIPSEILSFYDGGSMVGMRVGLMEATNISKMFVYGLKDSAKELLCDVTTNGGSVGWNNATFETPVTLDTSKYDTLFIGYVYEQTSTGYPYALVAEGDTYQEALVYGDYGAGDGWYQVGTSPYGNLAVQVLVEKEFSQYNVDAVSCKDVYVKVGDAGTLNFKLKNMGKKSVENVSYKIDCDGTTSEEQTYTLDEAADFGSTITLPIVANPESEVCTKTYTITITKVNGEENVSTSNSVSGSFMSVKKLFTHRVAVEEYTGTGSGYCPRGWVGMKKLRKKFGDSFIGIDLHQYSTQSKDAMYIQSSNYAPLSFSGAPSCRIERGEEIDPYYGAGNNDICNDFQTALDEVAAVGVEVVGIWNDDKTQVEARTNIETFDDGKTYNVEYVLVADSLTGTTGFKQSNYYYTYQASQFPEDFQQFCSGGEYGQSTISGLNFNDVAIASSYVDGSNQVKSINNFVANVKKYNNYTITMPTYARLVTAIQNANYNVSVVALIIDPESGKIVNAAKNKVINKSAFCAKNVSTISNNKFVLPIYLNNTSSNCGFQFDVTLPEGLSIATNSKTGKYEIALGSERFEDLDHTVSSQLQSDGSIRILCSSTTNSAILDTDINDADIRNTAPILNITINVADDVTVGDYDIALKNIILTGYVNNETTKTNEPDSYSTVTVLDTYAVTASSADVNKGSVTLTGENYQNGEAVADSNITLTATPADGYAFVRWTENGIEVSTENPFTVAITEARNFVAEFTMVGDVFEDQTVDVADLTSVAGIILSTSEVEQRKFAAADAYKDGVIDVADYTQIASIILNGNSNGAKAMSSSHNDTATLTAEGTLFANEDGNLIINLNSAT